MKALTMAKENFGKLDVTVNCAGIMYSYFKVLRINKCYIWLLF